MNSQLNREIHDSIFTSNDGDDFEGYAFQFEGETYSGFSRYTDAFDTLRKLKEPKTTVISPEVPGPRYVINKQMAWFMIGAVSTLGVVLGFCFAIAIIAMFG